MLETKGMKDNNVKTTHHSVLAVHKKNWEPLVFLPALAMERIPEPVCFSVKFSSANFSP